MVPALAGALFLGGFAAVSASDRTPAPPEPKAAHQHHSPAAATTPAAAAPAPRPGAKPGAAFTGDRAETERFIGYDKTISLSAAQEAVRVEALTPLAAPCCSQFSAATCCCRCNMMRARDGLAKHLIADLGLDATTVRAQVSAWHQAINPDGFSGDSCSTGQCGHAFSDNGCGGMNEGQLVF